MEGKGHRVVDNYGEWQGEWSEWSDGEKGRKIKAGMSWKEVGNMGWGSGGGFGDRNDICQEEEGVVERGNCGQERERERGDGNQESGIRNDD